MKRRWPPLPGHWSARRNGRAGRGLHLRVPVLSLCVIGVFLGGQVWANRVDTTALYLSGDGLLSPHRTTSATTAAPPDPLDPRLDWAVEQLRPAAPATTIPPPTTLPPPPTLVLPVPDPLPANAYADTPEVVLGRITIPAIGVDEDLQSGMTLTAINRGPSHWPGTAQPGGFGNAVIAGHRSTFTRPFRHLDKLQPGDQVIYSTPAGTFTYGVQATEIVDPDAVRIADQTVGFTSTLFACHPPGSATQRIVIHLQLLDALGQVVPPPAVNLTPVTIPRF